MHKLISVQLKLLYRNKRLKDVLVLVFLTGVGLWAIAFYEHLTQKGRFSFDNFTFSFYLTTITFIIPLALTSNLFSFFWSFIKFSLSFTNNNENKIAKSFILLFMVSNLCYNILFLTPLFLVNNEVEILLSLILMSTGIGIPVSILISSLKITLIDLSKSKTHNYSGLSARIISLIFVLLFSCFLLLIFSEIVFSNKTILPLIFGTLGLLATPLWIKSISKRLFKIKNNFEIWLS